MSDTPKKILFMIMKDSARLLVNASSVAFIVSALRIPFFFMMSMAGLMYVCVTSEIPMKQYMMPTR